MRGLLGLAGVWVGCGVGSLVGLLLDLGDLDICLDCARLLWVFGVCCKLLIMVCFDFVCNC